MKTIRAAILLTAICGPAIARVRVVPAPQYYEELPQKIAVGGAHALKVVRRPGRASTTPAVVLVEQCLLRELGALLALGKKSPASDTSPNVTIHLWDYSADANPPTKLNLLDRSTLSNTAYEGQSYVLRTPDAHNIWIIGSSGQAVLYGAMTLMQLAEATADGLIIQAAYIRDFPDFPYRAASDWLLEVEINRWALDRGRGVAHYEKLVKDRIDRALRFKINVALIDGFGWWVDRRFPGYGELMLRLNHYARDRGIRLMYGGYGAAYDTALHSGDYQGNVFLNRESYPDGSVYHCLAFPESRRKLDARTMGTCRGNDELNRLKAEDIRGFVDAIEPGALYIHHEDCCEYEPFQQAWLGRCERCRKRWPNDSLTAPDGGAGALAAGYTALIQAINSVSHEERGYRAARDTHIILVSPVYMPATSESDDWAQVLELWTNIMQLLPRAANVQIAFREVFPQKHGGDRWIETFNGIVGRAALPFRAFVFAVGGADNYLTDYPLSGGPVINAHFTGARTIYNATGDFYREPMEVISAEYSWNSHTPPSRNPVRGADIEPLARLVYEPGEPPEIFGREGLYERICELLYGGTAAPEMAAYYRVSEWLPEAPQPAASTNESAWYAGRRPLYLPLTWNRLHGLPSLWSHLLRDSRTWNLEINDERYRRAMSDLNMSRTELHRRLARRWQMTWDLQRRAAAHVRAALRRGARADSVEDLEFLLSMFEFYGRFVPALIDFHTALKEHFGNGDKSVVGALLGSAKSRAEQADRFGAATFPEPVDPAAGELRSVRLYPAKLVEAIAAVERAL